MHPYLGNQNWLTSYGLFLITGLAVCWWLARRAARRAGVDPSHIDLLLPLAFVVGAACVWLVAGPRIRLYPLLFGCTAAVFVYGMIARQPVRTLLDILALPAIAGIAAQRIGCFLAGCCWGDVAVHDAWLDVIAGTGLGRQLQTLPWAVGDWVITAVQFPAGSPAWEQQFAAGLITGDALRSLPVHPTQLYETALLIPVLFLLRYLGGRRMSAGSVALAAFAAYAVVRFGLEYLRADNFVLIGNLTVPQVTSAALFVVAMLLLRINRETAGRPPGQ